jgi:hypothetical protein
VGRAQRVLPQPAQTSAAGATAGTAAAGVAGATGVTQAHDAQFDDYYGEDEYEGEYADDFTADQELQTGMLRCGIEEDNEALMARFVGGLNKEM